MNLPELITDNLKDYEKMALKISNDSDLLNKLKNKILENKIHSNVFKSEVYTNNIEKAYKRIYQNYINGSKVETIKL
jgi:predicted O-linked N-acetylglucosamine transferase (SPINDLY family)